MIKAIIFDCDGVLVDSEHSHYLAWKHSLNNQGYDLSVKEYCSFAGNPTDAILKHLAQNAECDQLEEILKDKRAYYEALQSEGLPQLNLR